MKYIVVCLGVLGGTRLLAYMYKGFSTLEVTARNVLLRILRRKLAHQFFIKETVYLKIINIRQVKSMNLSMFSNVLTR